MLCIKLKGGILWGWWSDYSSGCRPPKFVEQIAKVTDIGFVLMEVWIVTKMKLFKEKHFLVFYRRSMMRSLWDSVETPGSRSWKGDEEGYLEHVAVVARWR